MASPFRCERTPTWDVKFSASEIELNLSGITAQKDWIVSALPLKDGESPSLIVAVAHWSNLNSDGSKSRFEHIVKLEDYPADAITTTATGISVNAEKLPTDSSQTLIVLFQVAPDAKVSLLQDGTQTNSLNTTKSVTNTIKNNRPLGMPVTNRAQLLVNLQTDRITQSLAEQGFSGSARRQP